MPDTLAISDADRVILTDRATKDLRSKIAGFVGPYRLMVKLSRSHLPSYVSAAITTLLDALDRWERDEKDCSC